MTDVRPSRFLFFLMVLICGGNGVFAETRVPQSQGEITLSFAPLVKSAAPAVVNIYAKRIVETQTHPFHNDPFFRNFFRDFGATRPQVENSLGSGVIVGADGIVVSNYHVVGGATEITVVLNDGREFSASPLLSDSDSDLAVLKLHSNNEMPYLTFRDSETVEVGELVLAIGNPFGVGQTVSSGIVSGLARSGTARGDGRGYFIQTDAPINPGNSGGALIDMAGQLIGINTSILTRSGGSNGIGFAIPASLVLQVVAQAQAGRSTFERPWAGLSGQALNMELAQSLQIPTSSGMIITAMHPQSPFKDAGFVVGDVITAVDGKPVSSPAEMLYRLSVSGIGERADITRTNAKSINVLSVDLLSAPDIPQRVITEFDTRSFFPGLIVSSINPAVEAELNLPWGIKGLAVIESGPVAASIGIRQGDILLAANGLDLERAKDIDSILSSGGRTGMALVQRGAQRISLRFRI
jgi:Do/DeqQ family serine protease